MAARLDAPGSDNHEGGKHGILYLLDAEGRPARAGILSLDTRAHGITERWEAEGRFGRMLEVTGQTPGPLGPAALLTWVAENEPESTVSS